MRSCVKPGCTLVREKIAERTAGSVWQLAIPGLIPGLLQTRDYASLILSTFMDAEPGQVEARVTERLARQTPLTTGRLAGHFIISEAAILRPVGTPWLMAEQLNRVATLGRAGVTIQVMPIDQWYPDIEGFKLTFPGTSNPSASATLMREQDSPVVLADPLYADLRQPRPSQTNDPETVSTYASRFARLAQLALCPDDSHERILRQADRFALTPAPA